MHKPLSRGYLTTGDISQLSGGAWTQRHVLNLWKDGKLPARLCSARVSRGKHLRFINETKLREFCATAAATDKAVTTRHTRKRQPAAPVFPEALPPMKDDGREAMEFGFIYILSREEFAGLTLAEREQLIADFRQDVAYIEAAKTPMQLLERFGERFTLEEERPKAEIKACYSADGTPVTKACYSEDSRASVAYYVPDVAREIDGSIRETLGELVYDVCERKQSRWIKKPPS